MAAVAAALLPAAALLLLAGAPAGGGGGDLPPVGARGPADPPALRAVPEIPLDLRDPTPRWVEVSFEISREVPGRLDARWSPRFAAWLQPAALRHWIVVSLPGPAVETLLGLAGERPERGSFSDFVWLFDTRTGHVVHAEMSGSLWARVGWGFLATEVQADIRAVMSTERPLGFLPVSSILGKEIFRACQPRRVPRRAQEPAGGACTPVPAIPFRPDTGYVNAPGEIRAAGAGLTTRSFSDLGEARFFEAPHARRPVVASVEPGDWR